MLNLTTAVTSLIRLGLVLLAIRMTETATYPTRQEEQGRRLVSEQQNHNQIQAILNYMDSSVDPCDDFFAYACGNWPRHHNTTRYTESTGLVDHKINKRFAQLLENYDPADDDAILRMVWTYYRSCKREKKIQLLRYVQLVRPAERIHWPIVARRRGMPWPRERFDWFLTLGKLRRYGFKGAIVEHLVLPKTEDRDQYVIDLDKGNAENPLPSRGVILSLLVMLEVDVATAKAIHEDIRKFERRLQALLEIEDEYGMLEVTVRDLEDDLPQLKWRKYLASVLGRSLDDGEGAADGDDFGLQIRNFEYFVQLVQLMEETKPETVANYIMVKFTQYLLEDGAVQPEKIQCIVDVRSKMDMATNHIYRQRFYGTNGAVDGAVEKEFEQEVTTIMEALRKQFLRMLQANRLHFRPLELEFMQRKIRETRINIGNLPSSLDRSASFVRSYYEGVELHPKNYYKNHLALLELRSRKEHQQIGHRVDNPEEYVFITDSDSARSSSPYYLMRRNLIIVPYGILQPPIFHKNLHPLLKMSLLGFLLAHEMAHGFDVSGLAYNYRGNYDDAISDNITENKHYAGSVRCLERETTDSIDERIADVVGIRLAYDAYFGGELGDPQAGWSYSSLPQRRLFFQNMAQFFCGSLAADFLDHDSDNVRLQQALLNFDEFAEEFGCDLGDAMHPEHKCRLW